VAIVTVVLISALAMAVFGQSDGSGQKASGVIQYKLVPVPGVMTQAQFQSVLTTQGNAGYRFIGPFAVGSAPIPNETVLLFSKP